MLGIYDRIIKNLSYKEDKKHVISTMTYANLVGIEMGLRV